MSRTLVRDFFGDPLLCCWDECGQWGVDEIKSIREQDGKRIQYIFCSDRHQKYWINATQLGNGNLPSGERQLWRSSSFGHRRRSIGTV